MEGLLPAYIEEHDRIMSIPAGSGTAAEFQMAASLKRMYLEKTMDYPLVVIPGNRRTKCIKTI